MSCKATARANWANVFTESALPISLQELALKANTHDSEEKNADIEQMQESYAKRTSEQGEYNMEVIKLLRRMKQTVEQKKAAQNHELLDCG